VKPLAAPVTCPLRTCLCLDRYAFLEDLDDRGRSLNLLAEYVRDCKSHQGASPPQGKSRSARGEANGVWAFLSSLLSSRKKEEASPRRLVVLQKDPEPRSPEDSKPE
jgi:hypothetical protein